MQEIFHRYNDHPKFRRKLLPGVASVLHTLRDNGIKTGIVTSGQYEKVHDYMRQMKLPTSLFDLVHTNREIGGDIEAKRPILTRAIGELGLNNTPDSVIFVGDEAVTKKDAEKVGANYIVVASGTVNKAELLRQGIPPTKLIDRMSELPQKIGLSDT